ncbi:hypothetical protein [Clostridium baratii]|uniref:hypothetical protein n=1 Tax=Clostridium baratii TaxID=1561 RepID=UPI003D337AE6
MKILGVLVIIVGILFTVTYFVRVIKEDKFSAKYAVGGALISGIFSFAFILSLIQILSRINDIDKYSIILVYFLAHLLLFSVICIFIAYFMIIIYEIYMFNKDGVITKIIDIMKNKFVIITKNYEKIRLVVRKLNVFFNPFRKIGNGVNINLPKIMKAVMLISYLISGVILLSYFTNYIEINGGNFNSQIFKREYDLYKNVFVTSLIPFTINYIKDLNKNDRH